jgi:C1A family cysteine protease
MTTNRVYGWKKQDVDNRDLKMRDLKAVRPMAVSLPSTVNLRKWCSEVEDQGQLGSCTANAWAGILQYNENKYTVKGRKYFNMSRLFIYFNERVIGNTVNEDSGAQLRDGAKAIATYGSCAEYDWPYDITKFTNKPTPACYTVALPNHIHSYYSLDGITPAKTLTNLKTCLASGQPFVFGFNVYDSFESDAVANTGIMPMPSSSELTAGPIGGHAVMAIGYNDSEQRFLVRNSWGTSWGLKGINAGYFTIPYKFISDPNQASDFWTVVKEI